MAQMQTRLTVLIALVTLSLAGGVSAGQESARQESPRL
jgi:hypothetical protein